MSTQHLSSGPSSHKRSLNSLDLKVGKTSKGGMIGEIFMEIIGINEKERGLSPRIVELGRKILSFPSPAPFFTLQHYFFNQLRVTWKEILSEITFPKSN